MHKDQAVDIAYNAENMTLEELLKAYAEFHDIVENTPAHMDIAVTAYHQQRALHGAIGLCTESAEILDAFKKQLYGKNKPLRPDNIREECGDVFFYLHLVMKAFGISLHDIIKDNVVKLANRYIDKLET